MKAYTTRVPRIAAALTGGAACAAAVALLAAPAASATPLNGLAVAPGLSAGLSTPYGSGCTYAVSVNTGATGTVNFNVRKDGDTNWTWLGTQTTTGPGTATAYWTPAEGPGVYHVQAVSGTNGNENLTVTVGTGINLGSVCLVL